MAERQAGEQSLAEQPNSETGKFDRDTAVWLEDGASGSPEGDSDDGAGRRLRFGAVVAPDWRAGRGPHGGYLAAMLLRALVESVADATRAPRSLTIHYARAPEPGPVQITTTLERGGRSLSTLSARMHQDGQLIALALAAFSVPWGGPEISDVQMPTVEPADAERRSDAQADQARRARVHPSPRDAASRGSRTFLRQRRADEDRRLDRTA